DFRGVYANILDEWLKAPSAKILAGNHDGNESEKTEDLATHLDNTFTPSGFGQRWFHFSVAGLAEFFALDSTRNQPAGSPAPVYTEAGEQTQWLTAELAKPALPWRFAMQHHPMFTAGPDHPPFLSDAPHWFKLFAANQVRAVFSGHEHNLQFSEQSAATGHMLFVVSGSGGELRSGKVTKKMAARHIAAWAPQRQFLIVELNQDNMKITPIGDTPLRLTNPNGLPVTVPVVVTKSKQP
ncbi:MAG: metallophosphoesterase, partial [Acidobacteria bacterium]|nr:metallophosphoesterase [Acidobacteriota bacterium]